MQVAGRRVRGLRPGPFLLRLGHTRRTPGGSEHKDLTPYSSGDSCLPSLIAAYHIPSDFKILGTFALRRLISRWSM